MSHSFIKSGFKIICASLLVLGGFPAHSKQGLEQIPLELVRALPALKLRLRVPKSMVDGGNDSILVTTLEAQYKDTIVEFARDKCMVDLIKALQELVSDHLNTRVRKQLAETFRDSAHLDPVLIVSFEDKESRVAGTRVDQSRDQRIRTVSVRTVRLQLRIPSRSEPGYKDIFLAGFNSNQFSGNNFCSLLEDFQETYRTNLPGLHRKLRSQLPAEWRQLFNDLEDFGEVSNPGARGIL